MPYGVIRKNIVESIANCAKNDQIRDISDVNDHSGREHACRIVVDLKRDADPNVVINQLYQYTPCQITVSMINIALVNRQPRTMGLKELIQHFIEHRREVITRRTRFQLRKAQQREHILEGLIFAVCDIDEVIKLIRSSKTRDEAIAKLRERAFRIVVRSPADRFGTLVPREYQTYEAGIYPGEAAQEKPAPDPGPGRGDRPAAAHPVGRAGNGKAGRRAERQVAEEIDGVPENPQRASRS